MKRKSSSGFVMADSLMGLFVITLAVNLLVLSEKQLMNQQHEEERKVVAARLGKEVSDQYRMTAHQTRINRGKMVALANSNEVVVTDNGRLIMRVRK